LTAINRYNTSLDPRAIRQRGNFDEYARMDSVYYQNHGMSYEEFWMEAKESGVYPCNLLW
jgi:hypothetical protein